MFIDITDTIQKKIDSLKKHVSQISGDRNVDEFVRANAQRVGQRAEMDYAEGFRRIKFSR